MLVFAMFDILKSYTGKDSGSIRFLPVKSEDVIQAERELGFTFPESLKNFYSITGYGWLSSENKPGLRNLFERLWGQV